MMPFVTSLFGAVGTMYVISDDLLQAHDAEIYWDASGSGTTPHKMKTITINSLYPTPSTLRVAYDFKLAANYYACGSRIYKNGAAFGTSHSTASTSYVTYSEDLSFSNGDTIELWVWGNASAGRDLYVQNFRVYGKTQTNNVPPTGFGATNS